jgi:hypothetical protein
LLEPGGDSAYLFHPSQSHFDRPMESSAWSMWVKRVFKRHHGEEIAPKTLRSVFITWLRDHTAAPEILKSAAHAMKHSEARQAGGEYDQESDDRLVKAAYDFNLQYAEGFQAGAVIDAGGAGSSTPLDADAEVDAEGVADALDSEHESQLLAEGWEPLEGGPFTARLMTKSRQPVSTATYRNFAVVIPIDPTSTRLFPGGQVRFPVVAGADDGVVCQLPRSWNANTHSIILRLKLAKTGATENVVSISSAFHRAPPRVSEDALDDLLADEPPVDEAPAPASVVPLAAISPSALAAVPLAELSPSPSEIGGDEVALDADDNSVGGPPDEEGQEQQGQEPAPLSAEEIADRLAALECSWMDEEQMTLAGTVGVDVDAVKLLLDEMNADLCELVTPAQHYVFKRSIYGERQLVITSVPPPPPPPPPPSANGPPVESPAPPRSSARPRKRKERFGDNGEFDGAASSFRSAPPSRKKSVSLDDEVGVPAYAFPGGPLWAKGWHAGRHSWFKARVVKLRATFPRIHVEFEEDEHGNTNALALPELSAYVHAADVRPMD